MSLAVIVKESISLCHKLDNKQLMQTLPHSATHLRRFHFIVICSYAKVNRNDEFLLSLQVIPKCIHTKTKQMIHRNNISRILGVCDDVILLYFYCEYLFISKFTDK